MEDLNEIERRLRNHLAALMDLSSVAEAETVRREVVELGPTMRALNSNVPEQWAVRTLFEYIDWRSKNALEHEIRWLTTEQASIDRALLSILDQSRQGRSVDEIRRARTGIDPLLKRINQLEPAADQAWALRCMWEYIGTKSSDALERAELSERTRPQRNPLRPTLPARETIAEQPYIEPPQIEWGWERER